MLRKLVVLVVVVALLATITLLAGAEGEWYDIRFGATKWSGPTDEAISFGPWLSRAFVTLGGEKVGTWVLVYEYGDISLPFWVEESAVIPLGVLEHSGYRYITPGTQKWSGPDNLAIKFGLWDEKWEYVTTDGAVIGGRILVYDHGDTRRPFWVDKDKIAIAPIPPPDSFWASAPQSLFAFFTLNLPDKYYLCLVEDVPLGQLGIGCYDRGGKLVLATFHPGVEAGMAGSCVSNLADVWWCEAIQFERDEAGHPVVIARSQIIFVTPNVRELANDP